MGEFKTLEECEAELEKVRVISRTNFANANIRDKTIRELTDKLLTQRELFVETTKSDIRTLLNENETLRKQIDRLIKIMYKNLDEGY